MPATPTPVRRKVTRAALIGAGIFDFAIAIFFVGWGPEVLEVEPYLAWIVAGGLAFGGVTVIALALTLYGPKRGGGAIDGNGDRPIVRR